MSPGSLLLVPPRLPHSGHRGHSALGALLAGHGVGARASGGRGRGTHSSEQKYRLGNYSTVFFTHFGHFIIFFNIINVFTNKCTVCKKGP